MTINYALYDPKSGKLQQWGCFTSDKQNVPEDTELSKVYFGNCSSFHYIKDGEAAEYPPKPNPLFTFNYETHQWEDTRSLDEIKKAKWESIKSSRDIADSTPFNYIGNIFDANSTSKLSILNSAQIAFLDPSYSVTWILADNSTTVLSAQNLLDLNKLINARTQANRNKAQSIREQLNTATTKKEVDSINW